MKSKYFPCNCFPHGKVYNLLAGCRSGIGILSWACLVAYAAPVASAALNSLVSVDDPSILGLQANRHAHSADMSADGRYVVFASEATNLVAGDWNSREDVFLRDLWTESTIGITTAALSLPNAYAAPSPVISADGRYVAFSSGATDLVSGDVNGVPDVFVYRVESGDMDVVSVSSSGMRGNGASFDPVISADGRYIAFVSSASNLVSGDTNAYADVFMRDTQLGTTTRVSVSWSGAQGNGDSSEVFISADGSVVGFSSLANNLVSGFHAYGMYVRDVQGVATHLVSVSSNGEPAESNSYHGSLSADGRYVAFCSAASNLVPDDDDVSYDVFVRDTQANVTLRTSVGSLGEPGNDDSCAPSISANGRYVAFESSSTNWVTDDSNGADDIFVRDLQSGSTVMVSRGASDDQGNGRSSSPVISSDGTHVLFASDASNFDVDDTNGQRDIFVRNLSAGDIARVTLSSDGPNPGGANDESANARTSANGRYIVFESMADNLVSGDNNGVKDVYLRDVIENTTRLVSVTPVGRSGNGISSQPSISRDGRFVTFASEANDLEANDTNGVRDIYQFDALSGTVARVSVSSVGGQADRKSQDAVASYDGRYIVFVSAASNLVSDDTNNADDIFIRDTNAGTTRRASLDSAGIQTNGASGHPGVSADGRYIVFSSSANNLVSGDSNGHPDIFLRDMEAATTTRLSVGAMGVQADGGSTRPVITDDGRFVAFNSYARNLTEGDTNGSNDIFLRDLLTDSLERVSVGSSGQQAIGSSDGATISSNGRYVMFWSEAANLVANDTNGRGDVFLRDRFNDTTRRISVTSSGAQVMGGADGPWLGADGQSGAMASVSALAAPDINGVTRDVFAMRWDEDAVLTMTAISTVVPDASLVGQDYSVAFVVSSAGGIPTGSVSVSDDVGASCGPVLLSSGVGSCLLASSVAGSRTLTLVYTPDVDGFAASEVSATYSVIPADTSLRILSHEPNASIPNQPVVVEASLIVEVPGAGMPTGPVAISDGVDTCSIPQGDASCTLSLTTRGPRNLSAVYAGDGNFNSSSMEVVHNVNRLPSLSSESYVAIEDIPLTVAKAQGVLAGASDPDGDVLVVANPGMITAVGIGGSVALEVDGSFSYTAAGGANGVASFEYVVSDGLEEVVATATITVEPVNDAPTFVLASVPAWPAGESGAKLHPGFASVAAFGPPDEAGQQVQGWSVRTISDPAGVASSVAISNDGTLSYTLSGNAGSATFGVTLQDDGGTANGGDDTSDEQVFTIMVAAGLDLSVAIDDDRDFAQGGGTVEYTIVVHNAGPNAAVGARVRSLLPFNLVEPVWACTPDAGASCTAEGVGGIDDSVTIPMGASLIYVLGATVLADPEAPIESSASVLAPDGVPDADGTNNSATDVDTVGIFADGFGGGDATLH